MGLRNVQEERKEKIVRTSRLAEKATTKRRKAREQNGNVSSMQASRRKEIFRQGRMTLSIGCSVKENVQVNVLKAKSSRNHFD